MVEIMAIKLVITSFFKYVSVIVVNRVFYFKIY
jgi:hypothetical protein